MTLDPKRATEILLRHFQTVSPAEFLKNNQEFNPDDVPPRECFTSTARAPKDITLNASTDHLGRRIAARRKQLNLSYEDMVQRAPLFTVAQLQQWESLPYLPENLSLLQLRQIAQVLCWNVTDLLGQT